MNMGKGVVLKFVIKWSYKYHISKTIEQNYFINKKINDICTTIYLSNKICIAIYVTVFWTTFFLIFFRIKNNKEISPSCEGLFIFEGLWSNLPIGKFV